MKKLQSMMLHMDSGCWSSLTGLGRGEEQCANQKRVLHKRGEKSCKRKLETGNLRLGPKEAHVILDRVEIGQTINQLDGFSVSQFR